MIALCTGKPFARQEGDQVIVRIPSGAGSVEIALSLHHAMFLWRETREAATQGFHAVSTRGGADVLPFRAVQE